MFSLWHSSLRGIFAIILIVGASNPYSLPAQRPRAAPSDPIQALLDLPAPLPQSAYDYSNPWEREDKPPLPGEDAPIELLIKYWTNHGFPNPKQPPPSERVKRRFLSATEKEPELIQGFLLRDLLPDTSETHDRLKAWLDGGHPVNDDSSESQSEKLDRERVRQWLMTHSRYFRDELEQKAVNLREVDGHIINEQFLIAFARLDWEKAKITLERHVASDSLNRVALGLSVQYAHAVETREAALESALRESLRKIVANSQASAYARSKACETLLKYEWPGRDEWYLSLFNDETLREPKTGRRRPNPLCAPLNADPDKWIPIIARMVGSSNRTVHDAAVDALTGILWSHPRREALAPLLPWLADPSWSSAGDQFIREQLVQHLARIQVPEAAPYLINILEGGGFGLQDWAARALANYHAPQAGPVLRKLGAKSSGMSQGAFAAALIGCGALSDEEKIDRLELYASKIKRVNADYGLDYNPVGGDFDSFEWRIGANLSDIKVAPVHLAPRLLERVDALRKENPPLADNLLLVVQRWPVPAVFQNIIERIGDGTADRLAIGQALLHREKLRSDFVDELQRILDKGGLGAGIAAALLSDSSSQAEILNGKDRKAQIALIACARLIRAPLPVDILGKLYKLNDTRLSLAVDRYLESEDSVEARKLVLAQHPGEAIILGGRWNFTPRPKGDFFRWEERLREEVKRRNGAEEIFSMAVGNQEKIYQSLIIRVRHGRANLVKAKDESRDEYRELTESEWRDARELFNSIGFDELTTLIWMPANTGAIDYDLSDTVFAHVKMDGGRRVFTNTVSGRSKSKSAYQRLYRLFSSLATGKEFRLRYKLEDQIKGLEVLYSDDKSPAQNICMQGRQARVLLKEAILDGEKKSRQEDQWPEPYNWRWRTVQNGGLGEVTSEPSTCPITKNAEEYEKEIGGNPDETFRAPWQLRNGGEMIRVGYQRNSQSYTRGVWRLKSGRETERIAEGSYGWPLVTRDGKWLLVTKYGDSAEKTLNTIVRFDLRTKQQFKTEFASKDYVQTVAEIESLGKVLIVRPDHSYLRMAEGDFYLLDPATGAIEPVKGEFRPLQQQTYRPLQFVSGANEYWAAIPNEEQNRTQFGRYDAKRFAFKPLLQLPDIKFDSMQMWVDETNNHIYITYNGHLLRISMKLK